MGNCCDCFWYCCSRSRQTSDIDDEDSERRVLVVRRGMGASQSSSNPSSPHTYGNQPSSSSGHSSRHGSSAARHVNHMSPYVNQLYVSSSMVGPDEAYMQSQLEAKRKARHRGLLEQLRIEEYSGGPEDDECPICMLDFEIADPIRRLPCKHVFHVTCIDDWLLRSFTCPTCMEPVDSAILASFRSQQAVVDIATLACRPASFSGFSTQGGFRSH